MEVMCAPTIAVATTVQMAALMSMFIAIISRVHTMTAPVAIHLGAHLQELLIIRTPQCVTEAAVRVMLRAKQVSQVVRTLQRMVTAPALPQQCQASIN